MRNVLNLREIELAYSSSGKHLGKFKSKAEIKNGIEAIAKAVPDWIKMTWNIQG